MGGDFDPNNFGSLSSSGTYQPGEYDGEDAYYADMAYEDITDPESEENPEDDDSRDLCSSPCIQCGKVPSYVLYELCDECLDKIGPQ